MTLPLSDISLAALDPDGTVLAAQLNAAVDAVLAEIGCLSDATAAVYDAVCVAIKEHPNSEAVTYYAHRLRKAQTLAAGVVERTAAVMDGAG